jgi:PhnB protein
MPSHKVVQPYLNFEGRCEEALEFYRRAAGAEILALMRWKDSPDPAMKMPGADDKVMHASVRIGETTMMASDGRNQGKPTFQGFSLSLTAPNEAESKRLFDALAEGGRVDMPLMKTFFSPSFGTLTDRFGVSWMVYVEGEHKPEGGARGETLAKQFEAKAADALAALQRLTDADWKKATAGEKWSVGVTAHHVAGAFEPISNMLKAVASGTKIPPISMADLDQMNAQHAKDFAGCTKAETIDLFKKGAALAARTVRELHEGDLAKTGTFLTGVPPMSAEQLITMGLFGHMDDHVGSIKKTLGH